MSAQLIIAGFHRSGTSLTAQMLHRSGLFLGYELVKENESNLYGHFEDWEVRRLHDEILADNGTSWIVPELLLPMIGESYWRRMQQMIERRNVEHKLWGFKDPRVCLFMGPWKYLLPEAKVLLVYRHFADSTYSLHRRHSTDLFMKRGPWHQHRRFWEEPDLALRMWLVHNNALLAFARSYPEDVLAVSFEMMQEGFPLVRAINQQWGLGLEETPTPAVFDPGVAARRNGRQPVSDRRLIGQVNSAWRSLERLSRHTKEIAEVVD